MNVPPRVTVYETRAERALSLPASLVDVAELLDVVRTELVTDGRPASDALLRLDDAALVVAYVVPAKTEQPKLAPVLGFR
ncbi:hypothetical protein [Streptomyces sp. RKAG293]|uniref:hypothetical protein n=1 Tax=Streptomyces sp. RKAG293 TaxID=2893403 RepID=UPI002033EA7C|nr:hypothetical protein [Streptomyces sp. RKAG293]MCM2420289.1 hypothetical protein [Streptomyces sp. RKAG293]